MFATIQKMRVTPKFYQFFWLYYVRDVNLSRHCMDTFLGVRSTLVSPKILSYDDVRLSEGDEEIIYLCGVANRPRTEVSRNGNNFHLAMRVKAGSMIHMQHGGVDVTIQNAERLRIDRVDNPPASLGPLFTECRNWQFANAFASANGPRKWTPKSH